MARGGDTGPDCDDELYPSSDTIELLPYWESLDDLVRLANTIVVGRVTGTLLPCRTQPGRGFTVYSVEIEQVIAAESLRPGDTIGFLQSGGICEDTSPEVAAAYDPQAAYETELDPIIGIGSTYLFFLDPMHTGLRDIGVAEPWGTTYQAPPYGRFLIDADGRLQVVAKVWTCCECAAPRAVAGKTVAEAETTLRPVIERTRPTPTPTPEPGTPTPTSTPTPQPGTSTP